MPTPPYSFTCPKCGITTTRPSDVEHGWCFHCKDWTENYLPLWRKA